MKRAGRQRLLLLLVVVALLALVGWQSRRDAQAATGTLLALAPLSVQRITLTLAGASPAHFEKRAGHWWYTDGTPRPADDGRLAELAETSAAAVLSWRPASDFQPAKIGLMPPMAVLELDGQRLEFGEMSVTGPQRYVRVGNRIALISARYTPRPLTTKITQPD